MGFSACISRSLASISLDWVELAPVRIGLTDSTIAIQSAEVAAAEAADRWSLPSGLQVTLARRSAPRLIQESLDLWLVTKPQISFMDLLIFEK